MYVGHVLGSRLQSNVMPAVLKSIITPDTENRDLKVVITANRLVF